MFATRGPAALLLSLGLAKLGRRNSICLRQPPCSSRGIRNRRFPLRASRQDLNHQHAALVTDRTLPERTAREFFIAFAIILGGFRGRTARTAACPIVLGSVPIFVLGIGWLGSRSSGCAEGPQEARVTGSGG
jgi:hypothetical protein